MHQTLSGTRFNVCVNNLLQAWAVAVHTILMPLCGGTMWISIQHREPECCISQNNQLFNLPQSWVFMSRFGSDLSLIRGGLTLLVSNSVWCGINFFEINTEEKQSRWQSNQLVFRCIICDEVWTQEMCTNSQLYICKHDCTVLICTLHYDHNSSNLINKIIGQSLKFEQI